MQPLIRDLDKNEQAALEQRLQKFRDEFAVWHDMVRNDWELLQLVHNEHIELKVVEDTESLILGEKCVALYECRWCMMLAGDQWHVAICHDTWKEPVDLTHLTRKRIERQLSQRWVRRLFLPPPQR